MKFRTFVTVANENSLLGIKIQELVEHFLDQHPTVQIISQSQSEARYNDVGVMTLSIFYKL